MKIYKQYDSDLIDCESTIKVTEKVSGLITAMTARSSQNSLFEGNENYKVRKKQ